MEPQMPRARGEGPLFLLGEHSSCNAAATTALLPRARPCGVEAGIKVVSEAALTLNRRVHSAAAFVV